jgi:hypothetical protein
MTEQTRDQRLEDILDAFMAEAPSPHAGHVATWVRRYPEFRQEIMDFAASWAVLEHLPEKRNTVTDEQIRERGLAIFQRLREASATGAAEASEPITGLVPVGASLSAMAQRAGLTPAFWRALDRRLVNNVPSQIVAVIAMTIGSSVAAVDRYLAGPPRLAGRALYSSSEQPVLGEKTDFFDRVRRDLDLPEDRRTYLLSLEGATPNDHAAGGLES